ncbi:MAG: hypothetical protein ABI462_13215, partial [Ignavibacteria bacterium]
MKKLNTLFDLYSSVLAKVLLIVFFLLNVQSASHSQILKLGQSVVTSFQDNITSYSVVRIVDTRNIPPFVAGGNHWIQNQFFKPDWVYNRMYNVFGIALDNIAVPNIFVSSTSVYCNQFITTDSILIYRIDGITGAVTNYVRRENSLGAPVAGVDWIRNMNIGPGAASNIGNICFDKFHDQLLATNMEDGRIYIIRDNTLGRGIVFNFYDFDLPNNDNDPGFAPMGQRLWGIGSYGTNKNDVRVYFGRWRFDKARPNTANQYNEIWSIALNTVGDFVPTTVKKEIEIPKLPDSTYSNPVSDIEFSFRGDMLLGERTMAGDQGDCVGSPGNWAHKSRILEYPRNISGNYTSFIWHKVGLMNPPIGLPFKSNSAGGVDFDYGVSDSLTGLNSDCDSTIIGTGDYLLLSNPPGFFQAWYGLQVTKRSSAGALNVEDYSHVIDLNGLDDIYDKTKQGDVDVYRLDVCDDTTCIKIMRDTTYCDSTGTYIYEFQVFNN